MRSSTTAGIGAGLVLATWASGVVGAPVPTTRAACPNIVFILIDDMRFDAMSCAGHPFARTPNIDRLAAQGVRFTNAFVTTSLCSPSRASFLTGVHAHKHGVRVNSKRDPDRTLPTFPQLLHKAGYETAFVGKWHMKPLAGPREGFDYWLSFRGQGRYTNPELNENGQNLHARGYMTDLLTDYAVDFLKRPHNRPFCLCLWHKAVHAPFTPAPRHEGLYTGMRLPEPASAGDNLADKPKWMRAALVRGVNRGQIDVSKPVPAAMPPRPWDERNPDTLNWYRALAAVDDSVGRVLDALRDLGVADRTVIIFASDNGFFHGEHRRGDKRLAFEESIRIPLLISGPGAARRGSLINQMVLNLDVAPTILQLAGVAVPGHVQGRSLKLLLEGRSPPWRESFLYEYFQENRYPGIPAILGVRTIDHKYVRYPELDNLDELYDLKNDPHELRNLANDPSAGKRLAHMRAELDRLIKQTGYSAGPSLPHVERPGELVLHYDFEGSASRMPDRSGMGHDVPLGHLTRTEGRSGLALRCDGKWMMQVYHRRRLDPSNKPWTVAAWIKPAGRSGVVLARGGESDGYALALRDGRPEFGVRAGGELVTAAANKLIGDEWVHIVGVIAGDRKVQIYVNGALAGSARADSFLTDDPFEVMEIAGDRGSQVLSPKLPRFRGLIDDVKLFDGELSAEEIAALASR